MIRPVAGLRGKVIGTSRAIDIVADIPGIAPRSRPALAPSQQKKILYGVKRILAPWAMFSSISLLLKTEFL